MKPKAYAPILLMLIGLLIVSCTLGGNSSQSNAAFQEAVPILELAIQPDQSSFNTVGQVINFQYTVRNVGSAGVAGNVLAIGMTVNCPAMNAVGNFNDSLDPDETITCTSSHTITQTDIDLASITFVATANINGINSNQVMVTVPLARPQALSLSTTANPTTYNQAGNQITFTYVITNISSADVGPAQFTISDNLISTAPFNCGNIDTLLPPAGTVTCTSTYTVTDEDVSKDSIASLASASGGGSAPSQQTTVAVERGVVAQSSPANLTSGNTISYVVDSGDWIWQIARCHGADPIQVINANPQIPDPAQIFAGMTITVPNIGSKGTIYGKPCVVKHTVKSGETWESIAQLYNADSNILKIANKNILNVGSEISIPRNSAGTLGTTTKALSLTITANHTSYEQVGQQIVYTYVIKNSGNTTLGPVQFTISDNLVSGTPFNCGDSNTTLIANATVTCTATYTITQDNLNIVSIVNNATASGNGVTSPPASFTLNKGVNNLTLVVSANPTTYSQEGQQIVFTYVIKNNGTSTLGPAQFTISDNIISFEPFNCGDANTILAPDAMVTCTATYTVNQEDMGLVSITNNATASGGGVGPSQPASTTVTKQ
ncbi:MAG: LysM peptidoglycan-binding domain-containing protein [Anaerolineales bacterium]|nr:LysM peptidoglycan-binding domain-containing protein [Anaerolineales bacterium]